MSGESLSCIGFLISSVSVVMLFCSVIEWFHSKNRIDYGNNLQEARSGWIASVVMAFCFVVGVLFMSWGILACEARGYSEHELTVKLIEVTGPFTTGTQAKLDIQTSPISRLHPAIEKLQKDGLNRRFNQQFTEGQKIKLRIYENYVGGLSFNPRVELAENKND